MRDIAAIARVEAIPQRGGEGRHRNAFVDRRVNGPATLAAVADAPLELAELRIGVQRLRGEVEQPTAHDAAAAPQLADRCQVDVVLVVLGMCERGGLSILGMRLAADVCLRENVEPFGVRGHQSVLDAVVHHFHEVACATRAAMQPTALLAGRLALATRRSHRGIDAWCECIEDRGKLLHRFVGSTNHQAIAALKSEYSTASTHIDVVDSFGGERRGAVNVVAVPRVAAIDQCVAGRQQWFERSNGVGDERGGHHQPDVARRLQCGEHFLRRTRPACAFLLHCGHGRFVDVVRDTLVPGQLKPSNHVGAHAPQPDHCDLHAVQGSGHKVARRIL